MSTLILFAHDYPDGLAMCKRLHLYVKSLAELGSQFNLLVIRKKYNSKIEANGNVNYFDGIAFMYLLGSYRFRSAIYQKIASLFNIVFILYYLIKNINGYKNIFLISFGWFDSWLITVVCKIFKKNIILEVNEKPYITAGNRSEIKILQKINSWCTLNLLYPQINGFFVISENLESLIRESANTTAKFLRLPILVASCDCVERKTTADKPFILHAGTLNEQKDGIIEVFEAFALAYKHFNGQIQFRLTNRQTSKNTLQKIDSIIETAGMRADVVFYNYIPEEELYNLMVTCKLAIVNRPENEQNKYNFSTKIGEYLSFGIPLVSTAYGEVSKFLVDRENSVVVESGNTQQMSRAIIDIITDERLSEVLSIGGYDLSKNNFYYKNHSRRIAEFIENL